MNDLADMRREHDPHHGHDAHSISEPCIPQCSRYREADMKRDDIHPEHAALREAFNAMVMWSPLDGEPLYRTAPEIGQRMPPSVATKVKRVLRAS